MYSKNTTSCEQEPGLLRKTADFRFEGEYIKDAFHTVHGILKAKILEWCEQTLQLADKRREVKGKGERERYTQLNLEFQTRARRDKKALSEQCKEIEESNRMEKTRDLFKKIRDIKRTFHAKMDTIKDINGMDLIEAKDIKKRW